MSGTGAGLDNKNTESSEKNKSKKLLFRKIHAKTNQNKMSLFHSASRNNTGKFFSGSSGFFGDF